MKKEVWVSIFFVLMILSFFFDSVILKFVTEFLNTDLLVFMSYISHNFFIIIFSLIAAYLVNDKKRVMYLFGGLIGSYLVSVVLKLLIQRTRPVGFGSLVGSGLESFGFPSSHATLYFFLFAFMSDQAPKYRWWFLGLALMVGFSRVYLGKHYLSDVIGGSLLGMGVYYGMKKWVKM
jgi:undecaprenyl-diphosphatase